jgi:hypothetical protein
MTVFVCESLDPEVWAVVLPNSVEARMTKDQAEALIDRWFRRPDRARIRRAFAALGAPMPPVQVSEKVLAAAAAYRLERVLEDDYGISDPTLAEEEFVREKLKRPPEDDAFVYDIVPSKPDPEFAEGDPVQICAANPAQGLLGEIRRLNDDGSAYIQLASGQAGTWTKGCFRRPVENPEPWDGYHLNRLGTTLTDEDYADGLGDAWREPVDPGWPENERPWRDAVRERAALDPVEQGRKLVEILNETEGLTAKRGELRILAKIRRECKQQSVRFGQLIMNASNDIGVDAFYMVDSELEVYLDGCRDDRDEADREALESLRP